MLFESLDVSSPRDFFFLKSGRIPYLISAGAEYFPVRIVADANVKVAQSQFFFKSRFIRGRHAEGGATGS